MPPTPEEQSRRDEIFARVLDFIRRDQPIRLPDFDPAYDPATPLFPVGIGPTEPNDFAGTCGDYRFQFEGEEDLLHLIVTRGAGSPLTVEDAQTVVSFVLAGVPPALVWLRPGHFSQHFYVGHDELLSL